MVPRRAQSFRDLLQKRDLSLEHVRVLSLLFLPHGKTRQNRFFGSKQRTVEFAEFANVPRYTHAVFKAHSLGLLERDDPSGYYWMKPVWFRRLQLYHREQRDEKKKT